MEIIRNLRPAAPKAALFDFDGTISLIVAGWRELLIDQFVAELRATPRGADEPPEDIERFVASFVDRNTGKPTIYQSYSLVEEIRRRDGTPLDPREYDREHARRVKPIIATRLEGLRNGNITPDSLMIPGSRELLERFRERGTVLYLASGSNVGFVREECELLGITHWFDGGIYGALPDPEAFSKAMIINQMLEEQHVEPGELVGFGDGHTETENMRAVGGYVVGVASNEIGAGGIDPVKRALLIESGADVIIPDYRESERLMRLLYS